ncbi:MAG: hypothetical protein WA634_04870 [Silvibacterium sp.]
MAKRPEYERGAKAREHFERTMTALFRVPKDTAKKPQKPERKDEKKPSKD